MVEENNVTNQPPPPSDRAAPTFASGSTDVKKIELEEVEFSNAIRLTGWQWIGVGVLTTLIVLFTPTLWKQVEPCTLEPDHRIPDALGNDYWLYERYAALAVNHYDTLILGDSVVWGDYVLAPETLSHYLNELAGEQRYANLGLKGAHPLALTGLLDHYLGSVSNKNVVLHCNPLWMHSPRADLRDEKVTDFTHSRLIPQYIPNIPSYKEEDSTKLGVKVEQYVPFNSWTTHLQQVYYDQKDIPSWTLEHPYENPIIPLKRGLPPQDKIRRHLSQPWYKSRIPPQDYPWVDMESSLQWRAFQQVVKTLQKRGNRVFVVVGPFNEHLLTPKSLKRYQEVKATIAAWLQSQQIPHMVPPPLASDLYGDASHPLAAGYAELARQLHVEPSWRARTGQE